MQDRSILAKLGWWAPEQQPPPPPHYPRKTIHQPAARAAPSKTSHKFIILELKWPECEWPPVEPLSVRGWTPLSTVFNRLLTNFDFEQIRLRPSTYSISHRISKKNLESAQVATGDLLVKSCHTLHAASRRLRSWVNYSKSNGIFVFENFIGIKMKNVNLEKSSNATGSLSYALLQRQDENGYWTDTFCLAAGLACDLI